MPIYEYICSDCGHHFETLVMGSEAPACPKCESRKLAKQFSTFAALGGGGEDAGFDECGADMGGPGGPCGMCGDPRGAGACSMDDFD